MEPSDSKKLVLRTGDALIAVDIQNDFLPEGRLAIPNGDEIIPAFNLYIEAFQSKGFPIFATRDWHPPDHVSFKEQGGPWPPHCVVDTDGAQFAPDLHLPESTVIISKATRVDQDAYSGFQGTDLDERLRYAGIDRLFIGGLATDYCVLSTVKDAIDLGYKVLLLQDAIRAVNVNPEDEEKAEAEMRSLGAIPIRWEILDKT